MMTRTNPPRRASASCRNAAHLLHRLTVLAAAWLVSASTGFAQTGSFDWATVQQLGSYAGIKWANVSVTSPRTMNINCLKIDTATPGLRFYTTPQSGTAETMTQTTRQFITTSRTTNTPVVAAINASAWNLVAWNQSTAADLLGLAVSQGSLVSPGQSGYPSFLFGSSGVASLASTSGTTDIATIETAVSGFGFALTAGTPITSGTDLHPRTGIGASQDGRYVYFLTIDGRQPTSLGGTVSEVGSYLKWFGAYDAINMDGGGSTTMAWWDPTTSAAELLNHPRGSGAVSSSDSERFNGNNIGVYYAVVPEPSTWIMTLAALACGVCVRGRSLRRSGPLSSFAQR